MLKKLAFLLIIFLGALFSETLLHAENRFIPPKTPYISIPSNRIKEPLPFVFDIPSISKETAAAFVRDSEKSGGIKTYKYDSNHYVTSLDIPDLSKEWDTWFKGYVKHTLAPFIKKVYKEFEIVGCVQAPNLLKHENEGTGGTYHLHRDISAKITVILYLSEGYEGGGTRLVSWKDDMIIRPKMGSSVVFPADVSYLHAGMPVKKGARYILVFWLTDEKEKARWLMEGEKPLKKKKKKRKKAKKST